VHEPMPPFSLIDACPGKTMAWSKEHPCTTFFDNAATFVEKCLVFPPYDGHTSLDSSNARKYPGQTMNYAGLTKV